MRDLDSSSWPKWPGRSGTWAIGLFLLMMAGCASIPPDRYGVVDLEFEGVEQLDSDALASCLATGERPHFGFTLGLTGQPSCSVPPFDAHSPRLNIWRWPWTDWPLYDEVLFERDLDRIVRWYEARGFPDARVLETRIEPASALESDSIDERTNCDDDPDDGCEISIVIVVEEGDPVLVTQLNLLGLGELEAEVVQAIRDAIPLDVGQRFDEAFYEDAKVEILRLLVEASYARSAIAGQVRIDRRAHTAEIDLLIESGPRCVFGETRVTGHEDLPRAPIHAAAEIEPGSPFSTSVVRGAQAAIYDLNGFASVAVTPVIPSSGNVIKVDIQVIPAQRSRFQVGIGVQSGLVEDTALGDQEQIPQWDLHLLGRYEHRNLFGGIRRLTIEDKPRMVFPDTFPRIETPQFGNTISVRLQQPGFIDPRLALSIFSKWELGPDPYIDVFRHEVNIGLSLERYFVDRHLLLRVGARESFYLVPDPTDAPEGTDVPSNYDLFYFNQVIRLDVRDDVLRTRSGIYTTLALQQAGLALPSSWTYWRIVPDLSLYAPLPFGMVLASRLGLGMLLLQDAETSLDEASQRLGPTTERLRGGGAGSNRGFAPGQLGDGPDGGIRRWLASLELRLPVTRDFWLTLFGDAGDVSQAEEFRFDHPQISIGIGFRLITFVGPITLNFGWRVPDWQVFADEDLRSPGGELDRVDLLLFTFPGAINLTIGDTF